MGFSGNAGRVLARRAATILAGCIGLGCGGAELPAALQAVPVTPSPGSTASSALTPVVRTPPLPLVVRTPSCEKLESLVAPLLERGYSRSLVIGLVTRDTTLVCPFGELGNGNRAGPDTLYEIGSLTKTFTGTLLAMLVSEQVVRLDEPVERLLPPGTHVPSEGERPITLFDLATHHSGLARMPDNMPRSQPRNPYADYSAPRLYEYLRGATLSSAPGKTYLYSNLGMGLLGHALALRTGRDFDALVRERIVQPLGMSDTTRTLAPAAVHRLAEGRDADGGPATPWDFDVLAPAGALRSSGRDMVRYLRAALGFDRTSVTAALRAAEAPLARTRRGQIGLAFHVRADGVRWHDGETAGHSSYLGLDHDKQCGVVVLNGAALALTNEIGERALHFLGGTPLAPLELPEDAPLERAADYTGDYPLGPDYVLNVRPRSGALEIQATGQNAFRLWHSGNDRFYLRAVEARVSFERDGEGRVSALVLEQGGRRQRAPRVEAFTHPRLVR